VQISQTVDQASMVDNAATVLSSPPK